MIGCQGTSTDAGPYYLGEGKSFLDPANVKSDLRIVLGLALKLKIPFVLSLGAAGADVHLNEALSIVNSLAKEESWHFRAAVISGEINKAWLKGKLESGARSHRLAPQPKLAESISTKEVERSTKIVAQMGPEPIIEALELCATGNADGVITGRSLDTGLFAALPLKRKLEKPNAWHFGLVLHDGGQATEPTGHDGTIGIADHDSFTVTPLNPVRRCTTTSVASISFYERADITREFYPGGYLDLSEAKFEQIGPRTVRVCGSKWVEMPYTIKVEGAALIGYRTICIAGMRDPTLIRHIQQIIESVKKYVTEQLGSQQYQLHIRTYGKNGVMEEIEPNADDNVHELAVLIDAVGQTQDRANSVCAMARSAFLHSGFEGRKTTAGNLAFPYSPSDIVVGRVYEFNIWHALELEDPMEPFHMRVQEFGVN